MEVLMFRKKTTGQLATATIDRALESVGEGLGTATTTLTTVARRGAKSAGKKLALVQKRAGEQVADQSKALGRTARRAVEVVQKETRRRVAATSKAWSKLEPHEKAAIVASGITAVAAVVTAARRAKARAT